MRESTTGTTSERYPWQGRGAGVLKEVPGLRAGADDFEVSLAKLGSAWGWVNMIQ